MLNPAALPPVQYGVVPFAGGLDQMSSSYQVAPGVLRDTINFACKPQGGYYRIPGYERFDGKIQPHKAEFITVAVTMFNNYTLSVGEVGSFGNINGTVCYVDPEGRYVGLTKTIMTFNSVFVPGPIVVNAGTVGSADAIYTDLSIQQINIIRAKAANTYRADIDPVPGSGPIRGVVFFRDKGYAFRDNVAADACDIWESTPAGWTQVIPGETLPFGAGTEVPLVEGETITQGVVTAKVDRWVVMAGDPAAQPPTAVGYFVISGRTGGAFTVADATMPQGTVKVAGPSVQITIPPGGSYDFTIGNFSAYPDHERIYGANGLSHAFEFDGKVYLPIEDNVPEPPRYVAVHSNHLFLACGSSVIHSALGNPFNFEVVNGAGEIGTGGVITGLLQMTGNQGTAALAVFARNSTWVLYGTSAQDWRFVTLNVGIGAWDHTVQNLFDAFALDDRGVTMMQQTLKYGNFDSTTITHNIQRFIDSQRGKVTASSLNRQNNQYRAFFNDGYGLYCTSTPDGFAGSALVLFPDPVVCCFNGEASNGDPWELFGTADGFVMRNDVGTSFDGDPIFSYLNTNINSEKSPRIRKRFRRCVLEIQGTSYVYLQVGYSFEWSSPKILPHDFVSGDTQFAAQPFWDSFLWDAFYWDGRYLDVVAVELAGTGENLQLMLISNVDYVEEFIVASATFNYTQRRGNR